MTPERYQQIDELFHAALARGPAQRGAFLDQACGGDESLRQEVESLITADTEAQSFIDEPAFEMAASLLVSDEPELGQGEHVDRYKILSFIGAGGMGEVYLAHDESLGRRIALKLLPSDFTRDEGRLRRFRQEARAASALNHPNIITIHEIGQVGSHHFIATEFIEGETLRQRTKRSPLTSSEALDIAIQVCRALAAAHEAGIVHRDIKPENIMLRWDGYVKVLDFGLAKLADEQTTAADPGDKVDVSSGEVMGTVKYMSPEQARGLKADARSDIFSLGVVLYEMAAGRAPYEGQTASEVVSSILNADPPPLTQFSPQAPSELQRVVSKALEKEKETRYQTIGDLLVDLKALKAKLERESQPIQTPWSTAYLLSEIKRHKPATGLIVAALLISAASVSFITYRAIRQSKAGASFKDMTVTRVTPSGKAGGAAISPDGKYVAYVSSDTGRQSLWIRQLASNSNTEIIPPGTNFYSGLTFSPGGDYLCFFGERKDDPGAALYQIPVAGGVPRKLLARSSRYRVAFSPDGRQLAFVVEVPGESTVLVANADGTEERTLATRKDLAFFWSVVWSPDGKRIACAGGNRTGNRTSFDVVEVGIEDEAETLITSQGWSYIEDIAWLSDGSGLLMTARNHEGSSIQIWLLYPDGKTRRITNDLNDYSGLSLSADSIALVTTQNNALMNIWTQPDGELDRARQITSGVATRDGLSGLSWTPDGRIVYSSFAGGSPDIWIMDANGSNQKQLTVGLGSDRFGLSVSPDGRYILFVSARAGDGDANIWRVDIDGNNPKQLTDGSGIQLGPFCSPDSKWVFYFGDGTSRWKVPIEGGDSVQLPRPYSDMLGISPDGKLMTYIIADDNDQASAKKIGIASFEGGEPFTALERPPTPMLKRMRFTPDGSALTYFNNCGGGASNIWSVSIHGGPPKLLTNFTSDLSIHCFDWSRDGKQLAAARGTTISDIVLIKDFR